jgi:DNA-binding beta-propeller fold protein YncE
MTRSNLASRAVVRFALLGVVSIAAALLFLEAPAIASGSERYEVWAIDQSNSPGLSFGGTLYIWDGHDLERGHDGAAAVPARIDLGGAVATMCLAKTGVNPVRPHMLAINPSQTHAIISFVASGHVAFLDADSAAPVDCVRTSVGAGGARQVHFAIPSPDERYVAVANQNGKLFERINTDYATNTFLLDAAAGINLATCTTPNGAPCESPALRPDNAPICPIIESTSRYTFVTLRGGGLFVVDSSATPMQIVAEYDNATVHPNGCGGAEVPGKMYIDSGGGTAANVFEADLYAFPVTGFSPLNPPNTPAPKVVFSDDVEGADTHGAALTKHERYLWVADRGRNFHFVVDTSTDTVVNRIPLTPGPSPDPTPDLLATSPNGSHVFMSLRGPNPLTADPHVSMGATPGVGVVKVLRSGRSGRFEAIAGVTNVDVGGVERADVHALATRRR